MRKVLLVAPIIAVAVAGCSSGDTDCDSSSTGTTASAAAPAPVGKRGARSYKITDDPPNAGMFIAYLENNFAEIPNDDYGLAVHRSGEICTSLDNGETASALKAKWAPMLGRSANTYVNAAIAQMCPDNK